MKFISISISTELWLYRLKATFECLINFCLVMISFWLTHIIQWKVNMRIAYQIRNISLDHSMSLKSLTKLQLNARVVGLSLSRYLLFSSIYHTFFYKTKYWPFYTKTFPLGIFDYTLYKNVSQITICIWPNSYFWY